MHAGLEAHNSEPLKEGAVWILSTASSLGYAELIQHAEDLKRAADADNREGQIQAFMHLKSSVLKLDGVDTQHLIDALKLTDDNVGENELAHKIHSSLLAKNEKFRPIVERFVTRLSEQVGLMQSALAEQDFKTLAELAHWLKGSAGSVGFDEFTELAEELENCSKSRDEKAAEHALSMIAHMAKHIDLD